MRLSWRLKDLIYLSVEAAVRVRGRVDDDIRRRSRLPGRGGSGRLPGRRFLIQACFVLFATWLIQAGLIAPIRSYYSVGKIVIVIQEQL